MTMPLQDSKFTLNETEKPPSLYKTPTEFSYFIEKCAAFKKTDCLSVLIDFCEEKGIDYEKIGPMINSSLKNKLAQEFSERGLLPPQQNSLYGL